MKKLLSSLGLAVVLTALSHALLLNPGSSILTPNTGSITGTLLASRTDNFTGINALSQVLFTGNIKSAVFMETSGALTFVYKITNDATSITSPTKVNINNFGGLTTDIDSIAPGNIPVVTDRLNPSIVGFTFNTFPFIGGMGALTPGTTSATLIVRTNATAYAVGSGQIIDGAVASTLSYAPVPEPATMAALGLGAAAIMRRRKKA